jgi:cytochrome oxidase Cu insertion factor (SCO1/SenC/PrrC family)
MQIPGVRPVAPRRTLRPEQELMKLRNCLLLVMAGVMLIGTPARAEFPRDKPAPAFTLQQLSGKPLSLASLKGKVVLLDFWGPS